MHSILVLNRRPVEWHGRPNNLRCTCTYGHCRRCEMGLHESEPTIKAKNKCHRRSSPFNLSYQLHLSIPSDWCFTPVSLSFTCPISLDFSNTKPFFSLCLQHIQWLSLHAAQAEISKDLPCSGWRHLFSLRFWVSLVLIWGVWRAMVLHTTTITPLYPIRRFYLTR